MLFAITCLDKKGALETRLATRPAHLAYLESRQPQLVLVGPVLDADQKPCGSLLVIEAPDQAAAEAFAAADPYAAAGLFAEVSVRPFRAVFKDGQKLG
jgi:uncharacterized protein YciI